MFEELAALFDYILLGHIPMLTKAVRPSKESLWCYRALPPIKKRAVTL
jgi:hypothetical protein